MVRKREQMYLLTSRQPWGIIDVALLDLGVQLRHTLVVKGYLATDQDIENDAKAPDIYFGTCVLLGLQQLWCGKIQAATKRREQALWREEIAQPEINDLDIPRLTDENILDLQISVHDTIPVAVVQGTCNLTGELARLLLLETAVRDDVVKHLSAVHVFEEHVPVVVGPDHIAHATNIRMVQKANNGSLPCGSDFFGSLCPVAVGLAVVLVRGLSRHDFDGDL
jgi:hypothetical protein